MNFVNVIEYDILKFLYLNSAANQREISIACNYSLGSVNKSINNLLKEDYIDANYQLTNKSKEIIKEKSPKNAIILAAGYGMRMVPINSQSPKALVEVNGEPLIERTIKQLHEVGIKEIYVVVGFLKEQFEYLIDEYGVRLIVNDSYSRKNNLHSLAMVSKYLSNTYIVPCDIWCRNNPFSRHELYSWYMVSDSECKESEVRVNRKKELVKISEKDMGNEMVGISYLTEKKCEMVRQRLDEMDNDSSYDESFWEEALLNNERIHINARVIASDDVAEINTYEQLRELDSESNHLKSDAINEIAKALGVQSAKVKDIAVLKKGMTNRSFLFTCNNKRYIMRIPGEGTEQLINRYEEATVYEVLEGKKICDDVVYINPNNGYKITEFLEGSRVCNPFNLEDLKLCMKKLRDFHSKHLTVNHEFDLFRQIDFYESLWNGSPSVFRDYEKTKEKIMSLKSFISDNVNEKCLSHIDAVPDNFLITTDGEVRLIDWEYSGMQDPHVDIAMFCIYALYDRNDIDNLINVYFDNNCPNSTRLKIYCYIAVCGLLWSNWCEYKRNLGVEFGEYSLRQYRYAKDFYKIFKEEGGF